MREKVTLLDGTELSINDRCRVKIGNRWRVATITEITQGTGVDRVFATLKSGTKIGPISRYRLRQWVTTG